MSVIKSSNTIREALKKRMEELDLTQADVCRQAQEKGFKIEKPSLSKYFKNNPKASLTEEQIIWLCHNYDIRITIGVGEPVYLKEEKKLKYVVKPYNEDRAIKLQKLAFNG